jgi:hypothetical protein
MNISRTASGVALAALVLGSLSAIGCGGDDDSSLGVSFTQSATAPASGLVKLVQKSSSGSHVVVSAVIYGPLPSVDMYSFAFDVVIGDPSILRFVTTSETAGDALVASGGQSVQAVADVGTLPGGGNDNARVVVGVTKTGGGSGNGFSTAMATVVNLTFAIQQAGTTTLAIASSPTPQALDSNGAPMGQIDFDTATASVRGTSTGGGGY